MKGMEEKERSNPSAAINQAVIFESLNHFE